MPLRTGTLSLSFPPLMLLTSGEGGIGYHITPSELALPILSLFLSPQSPKQLLFYFLSFSTISLVAMLFCFSQCEAPLKKLCPAENILSDIFLFISYEDSK